MHKVVSNVVDGPILQQERAPLAIVYQPDLTRRNARLFGHPLLELHYALLLVDVAEFEGRVLRPNKLHVNVHQTMQYLIISKTRFDLGFWGFGVLGFWGSFYACLLTIGKLKTLSISCPLIPFEAGTEAILNELNFQKM